MKNLLKRLTAGFLLICTLVSFIVPATYADTPAAGVPTVYDFNLANSTDPKISAYTWHNIKLNKNHNYTDGTSSGKTGWKLLEELYADSSCSLNWRGVAYSTTVEQTRIHNSGGLYCYVGASYIANNYLVLRLAAPATGAGKYQVSLTSVDARNTIDVYLLDAADYTTPVAAMVAENKIFTGIKTNQTHQAAEPVSLDSGEKILVIQTTQVNDDRHIISNLTLTPVVEEIPETSTAGNSTASTVDTTIAEESEQIIYNIELYNDDRYKPMFGSRTSHNMTKKAEGSFAGAYQQGQYIKDILTNEYSTGMLNWKVEGIDSSMTYENLSFYVQANTGMRIRKNEGTTAAGWVAFRITAPQIGTYDLHAITESLWGNHSIYLFPADTDTMSETALEEKMTSDNLVGTGEYTSGHSAEKPYIKTYNNVEIANSGEYIIVFQMQETSGQTTIYLSGFALVPSSGGNEDAPTSQPTDSAETTVATAPEETTTDTTAAGGGSDHVYVDGVYDLELYNIDRYKPMFGPVSSMNMTKRAEESLSGAYQAGQYIKDILAKEYSDGVLNWKVEGIDSTMTNANLTFYVQANTGMRIRKDENKQGSGWVAFRIAVPKSGIYDLRTTTESQWASHSVYMFPADSTAMDPDALEENMTSGNLIATGTKSSGHTTTAPYSKTYKNIEIEAAGEYIIVFQMADTSEQTTIYLSSFALLPPSGEEETIPSESTQPSGPVENLISGGATRENFFDMELYRYEAFKDDMANRDRVYKDVKQLLASSYPDKVNWLIEGYTETAELVSFRGKNGDGLRAQIGTGSYIAFRVNITKAADYHIVFSSVYTSYPYTATAYMIPAPDATMTPEQINAAITDENKLGTYEFTTSKLSYAFQNQKIEEAGEYVIILVANKARIYLSSIDFREVGAETPKTPVDKKIYNFHLRSIDPNFTQNTLNKFMNEEKTELITTRLSKMYADNVIEWKYEGNSETFTAPYVHDDYLRFKTTDNFINIENAWNAFRLDAPGAGTYDVRLHTSVGTSVINIYLIPAITGVAMTNQEIEAGMVKENLLIEKARLNKEIEDYYLGEYTFGANHEYVMVLEFVRGTRLSLVSMEMTKDGLVADGELPVGKTYSGVIYDLDMADPYEGVLYEKTKYNMADVLDVIQSRWRSGAQNWTWEMSSDYLLQYDEKGNTAPGTYLRFYSTGGMYAFSEKDAWVALRIKSPGSGDFTVTMNHAVCPDSGTVAMYILPADTPADQIWEATDPSNRVGLVVLTNEDGTAGKVDGSTSFVGYYNFEAGKEYIMVLESYEASKFNVSRANMNISQIIIEKGIKEYKNAQEKKTVNPINVERSIINVADSGNGNFALFEMNGMDYYLVMLEGGSLLLYNLSTGELEDEQFIQSSRPRYMQVAADGKVWITNSWKYFVCYDPVTKTYEKTKYYLPQNFKHNGPNYFAFDENGVLYSTLDGSGHVIKYNPKTKVYTDLGALIEQEAVGDSLFYKDGYLYIHFYRADQYNCLIKYNIATAQIEAKCEFMDLVGNNRCYGIGLLGDNILALGIAAVDSDRAIAVDINTMELVDLGVPGSITYGVTEKIDGKQYMIVGAYGLYEYDIATGKTSKVPGFTSMTAAGFRSAGHSPGGKSWATIDGEFCLITNTSNTYCCPRVINMETKEYYEWRDLTRDASGGGSEIVSFTRGDEGANEIVMGFWNAHYAATYNVETGTITNVCETAGQTDSIAFYKGILYGACYSATVLVEIDRELNTTTQRFKLDHEITGQKRLMAIETGDDYVFVGSVPETHKVGGALTVYNTLTGQWYYERNLVQDQSIIDMAYCNGLVYAASSRSGGDSAPASGDSALIVAYDYENRKTLATLDPRDYIPGIPTPVHYIYGLTADPNCEENGRIWAVVAETLFCFTFDRQTCKFDVQIILPFAATKYNTSSGNARHQCKIEFIEERNQLYVVFKNSGTYCLTLEDWNASIGKVKIAKQERIMGYKPEDFIIAEDGNMYFSKVGDLMMLPLNVTEEDWAIGQKVDDLIAAIDDEVTLESETVIKTARSAYENLSWYYKALVQNMEKLEEAEVDLLECKIAAWEGKEITADDVTALQELMDTYKPFNVRQKRYTKNYQLLRVSYDQASALNDQRIAAAMQKKVDALKDLFPIETLEKEPQVVAVRTELESLTGSQQYLLDTTILKEAEAQIAVLRAELVKQVEALIQAIPAQITLEAEPAIVAAREGVDKLYALERKQVSYTKLEAAESKLRNLKNALAKAEEFDALMKAIGIVTLGDEARIAEARQYYNSLNETARSFVTKYGKLQRAEFILSALQSWGIPVIVVADLGIAFVVVWFVPSLHKKVFKTKKREKTEVTDN